MRIIQANKYFYPRGGAETYLFQLSDWLTTQGHEIIPFSMHHPENLPSEYSSYFVKRVKTDYGELPTLTDRFHTALRMLYSIEARRRLSALITKTHPDLCHIHSIYTQLSPSLLHTLADLHVPTVMTVHDHHLISPQYNVPAPGCGQDYRGVGIVRGTLSKFHKDSYAASFAQVFVYKLHRAMKIYERHVDLFFTPSQYLKRQLVQGGFPSEKIMVNPYGIDAHRIEPRYDHENYFLYVGRLSAEKGVDVLIRLARQLPDVTIKIAGRGPQLDYLRHLSLDVPNVELLGFRTQDELHTLYQGACALLLPSRVHEISPLVLLESMARGTPVIASDVGGVGEVIEDHVSGLLVQPTDRHGWVEAMLRVLYDQEFHGRLAREARNRVERSFGLNDHYQRLMQGYEQAIRHKNENTRR